MYCLFLIPTDIISIFHNFNSHPLPFPSLQQTSCRFFQHTTPYVVDMCPGQVLYVPKHWWHFVETLESAISINTWVPMVGFKLLTGLLPFGLLECSNHCDIAYHVTVHNKDDVIRH